MTILLTLLYLLATDCRVHRVPMADTVGCEIAVGVVSRMPQGCLTKSHWVDTCAVKVRCDTVKLPTWGRYPVFKGDRFFEADSNTYVIRCHPETTLVDTIASKHYDSNDPNNLPCPKGYHGVRDPFGIVIDTDPPTYCYSCVKDTLVDSGGYDEGWWFSVPDGSVDVRKDETDTLWIFDTPFLRSEMPDLKEMLREWRVEKCIGKAWGKLTQDGSYIPKSEYDMVRDSCRCVYGGGK